MSYQEVLRTINLDTLGFLPDEGGSRERLERVASEAQGRRGCKTWFYSADFNERCASVQYVLDFLAHVAERSPQGRLRVAGGVIMIVEILGAIRQLMAPPPEPKKRPIGFIIPDERKTLRDGAITHVTLTPSVLAALPFDPLPRLRTLLEPERSLVLLDVAADGRALVDRYAESRS